MKISFVIPAYNEEKYIEECLSSIFGLQDLSDCEIIVVDNNSTDRTAEIVRSKFPQAKLVFEKKKSPAAARNAGAKVARGEFLAFIDADCRLPREWWVRVKSKFENRFNLVLLFGPYHYYGKENFLEQVLEKIGLSFVMAMEFLLRKVFGIGGPAYGGNIVIRKWAFETLEGFDEKFDFYGEDIDFTKRAMKEGLVWYSPKLWVHSSGRRFRKEGLFRLQWIYLINTLWVILFGRVVYKQYRPGR